MRSAGALLFLVAVVGVGYLEKLQFGLKRFESSRWWASNGRDVVNAFALCLMALGLLEMGFGGPQALTLAATQVLLLSSLQTTLAKHRHQAGLSVGIGLVLGTPMVLFPGHVDRATFWFLQKLFVS